MGKRLLISVCLFLASLAVGAQDSHTDETTGIHRAEALWTMVDLQTFNRDITLTLKLSDADAALFIQYVRPVFVQHRSRFFEEASQGTFQQSDIENFLQQLRSDYLAAYPRFQTDKEAFARQHSLNTIQPLAANGPCTNVDFENGTTSGWLGYTADACTNATPCNVNAGFSATRTTIVNATMTDPYIPTLPVVAPGGNYSLRLENYLNGGDAAIVRQTFMVSANNNVFTYRYAAVLEDPGSHSDNERPYFKVRLYDRTGREINCASYTAIAKPPIQNYQYAQVVNPNPGMNGSGAFLNLYYRTWTTVSIPLLAYVGQNVTIEFIASDCSLGGHLGYAYIDAECMALTPLASPTICGTQNITMTAASGFASYQWSGPGIVGATNNRTVTVNRAGAYTVTVIPYSDNPCPVTLTFNVYEHCDPPPVAASVCETTAGSGTATGVNLSTYTNLVTAYHTPRGTIQSWHSALPATTANKITTPLNVTITNGQKVYAVITYATIGGDTVELAFTVNPKPVITFPDLAPLCRGSAAYQITGVAPTGGVFSGTNVTGTGVFTPSTVGDFPIVYSYTNALGCSNTLSKTIHVQAPPTVNAGTPQTICASTTTIALNGTSNQTSSIAWSGGGGSYNPNANTLNATYTPSTAEVTAGNATLTLTGNGVAPCPAVNHSVTFTIIPTPVVNAGTAQTICASTSTIQLNGTSSHTASVNWSGGGGTYNPNANTLNATYTPSTAEVTAGTVNLILTGNGVSPCATVSQPVRMTIVPVPRVNAGSPQTICMNASTFQLNGTASNTSSLAWSGGSGTYNPNANTLNATYTPSASEISAGTVNLTLTGNGISPCAAVQHAVALTIVSTSTVNAGTPQTICASTSTIQLNGSSSNTSAVAWSGGGGTYTPNRNTINATYTPSASEVSAGSVNLTLTGNGVAPCPTVTHSVRMTIVPVPIVNAGTPQTICASTSTIQLNGSSSNTSAVTWSGGGGTYTPNRNAVNATYTPSVSEVSTGSVNLTLTGNGISPCAAVSHSVLMTIVPVATVNAGSPQTICANTTSIQLNGTSSHTVTISWSGGGGTYAPNANTLNATYTPSASEISSGSVNLLLTGNAQSPCPSVSHAVLITINPLPVVNAGIPQTICASTSSIQLNGSSSNTASVSWSGGTGAYAPDVNTLNASYTPSASEVSSGSVTLMLTGNGLNSCQPVTHSVVMTIIPVPTVNAGAPQTICASTSSIQLNGTSSNTSLISWSGGTGSYTPNGNTLTANYTPSVSEVSNGTVTLTLTGNGISPCAPVSHTVQFIILPVAIVNAGPDQVLCATAASVSLTASALHTVSVLWSGGSGNYAPDAQSLSITYTPTSAELSSGNLTLTLTGNGMSPCSAISDQMAVRFVASPSVNAGNDQGVCADVPFITLQGTAQNAASQQWSGGSGTYTPNTNNLNARYYFSPAELSSGTVTLTLTAQGFSPCASVTDAMNVVVHPLPVASLPKEIKYCGDTETSVTLNGGVGDHYLWTPTQQVTQSISVSTPGIYTVHIYTEYDCSAQASVMVREVCSPRIFVSSAFTPNVDGTNDLYTVYGAHIGAFRMLIFNRWGEVIFESKDRLQVWDGIYKNELMPEGVYPWIITYEGDTEEYKGPYSLEGSVTVIR